MGAADSDLQDRFFSVDGVRLRYVEAGEGDAVVLLHGFLGNVETTWIDGYGEPRPDVLPALARRFWTIALDARGHGRSEAPRDPARYGARMVDDVVALLDHLGVDRAHLVGDSMGAMVASKLLCERPDRVRRAVLGGGLPYVPTLRPEGFPPVLANLADDLDAGRGIVAYVLASTREGGYGSAPEQAAHISALVLAAQNVPGLAACARAMPGLAVTEPRLAANVVPTLALIGSFDDGLPELRKVARAMANLTVQTVEGGDHATTPSRPEFRRAVEAFLAER